MATTYLEGDLYPTTASVIPSILSLEEHFQITKEKDRDMKKRFGTFMDVKHDEFDPIYLIFSLLHPSKTLELNGELFEEGKRRLLDFIKQEIAEGNCLYHSSRSKADRNPHTQLFKRRRIVNSDTSSSTVQEDSNIAELKREVEEYIEILNKGDFHAEADPLVFWREKSGRFPNLSPIALQYLAMPATSASAERLFSCSGLSCKGKKTNVSSVLLESQTLCRFNKKFDF
ncbi:hypothetical protein GHT06_014484 [Daphnia sinensis]|uniref:HAT C-terminal dimerisation domain-containing protein n=1 Tax=Daphnia sinensis TaxID=1820382 RepID=A0AAD5LME2_9CRUS|nr:hypothetical protein GHT06_014484 [Daphnia sinensis]